MEEALHRYLEKRELMAHELLGRLAEVQLAAFCVSDDRLAKELREHAWALHSGKAAMLLAEGDQREHYDAVLGPIDDEILSERASEEFLQRSNATLGPSWMGGEYLPDLEGREVEIARVVLASVTMDVFSLRARLLPDGGYGYRMVDEYPEYGGP